MKEKIQQYLESDFAKKLIKEEEFYFQKGQDALQKWLNFSVGIEDRADLERLANDYDGLQVLANERATINNILNILFEIVSYCDSKAKDKAVHNQYKDNRTLAMAYVRMNHWIEKLIQYKFSRNNVPVGSILNAINYLLIPKDNATILSENHRAMISKTLLAKEYVRNNFIKDFEQYFSSYQIVVSNPKNYTYLLSCIIYAIQKEWLDDIIGLMASDNTDWKDYLINDSNEDDYAILWNSKRPTGTNNTLKLLRNKINNDEYFKLFYAEHGNVNYVAEIIDFVENDKQLKKQNWPSKYKTIVWYKNNFEDYEDGNKSASIVFLARSLYKIKSIPVTDFEIYKEYSYPRQDNLTPIVSEPDITIVTPIKTISTLTSNMGNNNSYPINQILYGPPGTGKTYNSINKAISIINPSFDLTQERSIIKKEYDRLVTENQILFTTFHQSMSYEDFIEGIKPETKKENVIYDVVPGLFLELCNNAENNWEDAKEGNSEKLSFEDAFLLLKEEWVENEEIKFPLKREGNDFTIIGFTKKSIQFKKASGGTGHTLSIGTLKDYYYKKKEVRLTGVGIYYPSILDKLNKYQPTTISKKILKNYVLIIDEINRGNVSQIFGELITLIEEDKRLGKDEALEVTLPYSKEKFGVPPNLYIIGTMNTADRSVEALDTALRRRFCFEEMPPLYSLDGLKYKISEYDAFEILKTMNTRIEKLIDKDHAIGHSYFLNKNSESIVESFYKNIIPLLQEYFFGDYGKIGLVLGKGFVKLKDYPKETTVFAEFDTHSPQDFDEREIYEIIDYRVTENYALKINDIEQKMNFELAIQVLMNKKFD